MALVQPCCAVRVPYYEGFNRFAVWPAPSSVRLYLINIDKRSNFMIISYQIKSSFRIRVAMDYLAKSLSVSSPLEDM